MFDERAVVPEPPFDLVVVVASAGGLRAAREVVAGLPPCFPADVLVLVHRPAGESERLAYLFGPRAETARDGMVLAGGGLYLMPAGAQATVGADGTLRLEPGVARPQGDALLRSAAAAGRRTIAVVLSGRLTDGAAGARAVRAAGGRVLVQAPETAERPAMPTATLATGCVIARALTALVLQPGAAELFAVRLPPWALTAGGTAVTA